MAGLLDGAGWRWELTIVSLWFSINRARMNRHYPTPLVSLVGLLIIAAPLRAQFLEEFVVLKSVIYEQTSAASPMLHSGMDPYWIEAGVAEGSDTLNSGSVTIPGGSNGNMTLVDDNDEWFQSVTDGTSQANLDAKVNDGVFTFNLDFATGGAQSASLTLGSDGNTFFGAIPTIGSLTNALWVDGKLQITAGSLATINFNGTGIAGFSDGNDLIALSVDGESGWQNADSMTAIDSLTLGEGGTFDLINGSYVLEIQFFNIVDTNTSNNFGNSNGIAAYNNWLKVDLEVVSAVPEPGTYALWASGLVFAGVICRRRRTVSAV